MLGLFRRKGKPEEESPLAPADPIPASEPKAFCIALSWKGLLGLVLIFCILQIWMFLIGMWAAQRIVFPSAQTALPAPAGQKTAERAQQEPIPPPAAAAKEAGSSSSTQ